MAGPSCSPPKSSGVKAHTRSKPRRKPTRSSSSRPAAYVVKRNGRVVSRHRTLTGAINARKRLDRQAFRAGQGRPYDVEKVS